MFDCLTTWSSILPKIGKQMVWVSTEEEAQLRKRFICIYTQLRDSSYIYLTENQG